MVDTNDKKLLELALSKQLVDRKAATEAYHRAKAEGRTIEEVLIESGVIAKHTVEALRRELDQTLAPDAIAGFRIIRKIGQGGMGSVYLAEQLSLGREVALKVISPHFAANAQAVDRFMREARIAALVNHPNIISVIDVGFDAGHLYMALELVSGGDAAQLAARSHGVLPEIRALEIIRDCCRGLEALHEAHLIHRDIKPANIFITKHGIAKLADLGLARSEQADEGLTAFGHAVGTPSYMSPEQAGGKTVLDIRSDIYSLGASLFALTTGTPPFVANGAYATVAKLLTEPPPEARSLNPALSEATSRIIARCLAKKPADRFQTPHDLTLAVSEVLAGHPATSGQSVTSVTASMHPTTAPVRGTDRTRRPPDRTVRATDRTLRPNQTPVTARAHKTRPLTGRKSRPSFLWPAIGGALAAITVMVVLGVVGNPRQAAPPAPSAPTSAIATGDRFAPPTGNPSGPWSGQTVPGTEALPATTPPAVGMVDPVPTIPGLVAYWPLDDGAGLQVKDLSGNGSTGTASGATWGTGRIGGAAVFSKPSKILCGNARNLAPVEAVTVMCWLKTSQQPDGREPVSILRHDGHFTALQVSADGKLQVVKWDAGRANIARFPWGGIWDDGRWHHYAVTYHRSEGVRIFKDGELCGQDGRFTGALPDGTSAPFVLGGTELDRECFVGSLDEVRVYDRQLSAAEIRTIAMWSAR